MPSRHRICLLLDDEPEWCQLLPRLARRMAGIPAASILVAASLQQARAQLQGLRWPTVPGLELAFICTDLKLDQDEWAWDLFAAPPLSGRDRASRRVIVHSGFLDLLWPDPRRALVFPDASYISKGQVRASELLSARMRELWSDDEYI